MAASAANRIKLNETAVKAAATPAAGFALYWDENLRGFGLRVTARGVRAFILQDRIKGRERRITLGQWPAVSAAAARNIAKKRIGEIASGVDIIADRQREIASRITLADAVETYTTQRKQLLKDSTIADMNRAVRETFDDWRGKPVTTITRDMVQTRYLERAAKSPARAVVAFRYLRAVLNHTATQHRDSAGAPVLKDNPVKVLSEARLWHKIKPRSSVMSPDDLKRWVPAVLAMAGHYRAEDGKFNGGLRNGETYRDLLLFIALTGCRRNEALSLTKADVQLGRGVHGIVTFPDTKNREDHPLPLTPYLHELLKRRMKASKSEFVFAARFDSAAISNLRYCLSHVESATGIAFTLHDLRRLAATTMERLGVPYRTVKSVLNHKGAADITGQYIMVDEAMKLAALTALGDFVLKHSGATK